MTDHSLDSILGAALFGMTEAAAENELLKTALRECAAEYRSPPCTIAEAMSHVGAEFERRMRLAADALAQCNKGASMREVSGETNG